MTGAPRLPGFRGEYLWELGILERQIMASAEAVPADKYSWQPNSQARSVSAVFVHVAASNFILLDAGGVPVPKDLYGEVSGDGIERFLGLIPMSCELEYNILEKDAVIRVLKRSLKAVSDSFSQLTDAEIERRLQFYEEETTVRRVYLRLLGHAHHHTGQMIAYLRSNGIDPPWTGWSRT